MADKLNFSHKDAKAQSKNRVLFFIVFRKQTPSHNWAKMRIWCENYVVFGGAVFAKSL
jgi:hypothetical protein